MRTSRILLTVATTLLFHDAYAAELIGRSYSISRFSSRNAATCEAKYVVADLKSDVSLTLQNSKGVSTIYLEGKNKISSHEKYIGTIRDLGVSVQQCTRNSIFRDWSCNLFLALSDDKLLLPNCEYERDRASCGIEGGFFARRGDCIEKGRQEQDSAQIDGNIISRFGDGAVLKQFQARLRKTTQDNYEFDEYDMIFVSPQRVESDAAAVRFCNREIFSRYLAGMNTSHLHSRVLDPKRDHISPWQHSTLYPWDENGFFACKIVSDNKIAATLADSGTTKFRTEYTRLMTISPNGRYLAVLRERLAGLVFDLETGIQVGSEISATYQPYANQDLSISNDGRFLSIVTPIRHHFTWEYDANTAVFDVLSGTSMALPTLPHGTAVDPSRNKAAFFEGDSVYEIDLQIGSKNEVCQGPWSKLRYSPNGDLFCFRKNNGIEVRTKRFSISEKYGELVFSGDGSAFLWHEFKGRRFSVYESSTGAVLRSIKTTVPMKAFIASPDLSKAIMFDMTGAAHVVDLMTGDSLRVIRSGYDRPADLYRSFYLENNPEDGFHNGGFLNFNHYRMIDGTSTFYESYNSYVWTDFEQGISLPMPW